MKQQEKEIQDKLREARIFLDNLEKMPKNDDLSATHDSLKEHYNNKIKILEDMLELENKEKK